MDVTKKASIVKLHGLSCLFFGLVWLLESFGVAGPFIGPGAIVKGWDAENAAMMFFVRFATGLAIGIGLSEYALGDTAAMQKIYLQYHIPLAILTWVSSSDTAGDDAMGYFYAILVTAFGLLGVIGQ